MKDDVLDAAPATGARFETGTDVARLVELFAQVYYRMSADINELNNSRILETATGVELDRKAREFGISRKLGESDDDLRLRALAGRTSVRSQTTFEEFADGALQFLQADSSDVKLTVDYTDEFGAVIVIVKSDVMDASPFDEATIVDFLEAMVPMDRRVVIRALDGFQFSQTDTTGEKSGLGFAEGEWTE